MSFSAPLRKAGFVFTFHFVMKTKTETILASKTSSVNLRGARSFAKAKTPLLRPFAAPPSNLGRNFKLDRGEGRRVETSDLDRAAFLCQHSLRFVSFRFASLFCRTLFRHAQTETELTD